MEKHGRNQLALDTAVRRFPFMLKQLRENFSLELIESYAPRILYEYRLILEFELRD